MSQSAVNEKRGAQTPIALLVASGGIVLVLLFLTELMHNLPGGHLFYLDPAETIKAHIRACLSFRFSQFRRGGSRASGTGQSRFRGNDRRTSRRQEKLRERI
jgi:sulfate permease family protein